MRHLFALLLLSLTALLAVPVAAQPPPGWADYDSVFYQQQGESLYVAITFKEALVNKGLLHAGNTIVNDYDDNINTGQPAMVGSETNLTFCDWDADNIWCMRVYGLWNMTVGGFIYRALVPVNISPDGKTMSFKHSLVGLGLEDISYYCDGYYLAGSNWWNDPWNQGGALAEVKLFSFNPSLVPALDTTVVGTKSRLKIPSSFKPTALSANVTGALDEAVTVIEAELGTISPQRPYTVTYNAYSNYPVFIYNAPPNNQFTTWLPGSRFTDPPDWWSMLEGAVYQTMMEKKAGYREIFGTTMATDIPLPNTTDGWYSTRFDSTHGLMWTTNHKVTFKAIIGRAYHNLMTIYIGEKLGHAAAKAAATAMRSQATAAYSSFSGSAWDLNPLIMTGFLLNKAGTDLGWVKTLWDLLPSTFLVPPADSLAPNKFGGAVKKYLRDGVADGSLPYDTRKFWYQNIAGFQAAAIDVATGLNIFSQLKAITNYPAVNEPYDTAKVMFQGLVGVDEKEPGVPYTFNLTQNYPNPFNPSTKIAFTVPEKAVVSLKVYDILGREIQTIMNQALSPGDYEVNWITNGLPSGVYFYKLEAGKYVAVRKAVLLK